MESSIPITHMFTDDSGHTRFQSKFIPLEPKTGLGSVGHFSSLFVNQILDDNSGDTKCSLLLRQFLTRAMEKDPNWPIRHQGGSLSLRLMVTWNSKVVTLMSWTRTTRQSLVKGKFSLLMTLKELVTCGDLLEIRMVI